MEIAKLYITLAADASQYQGTLAQVDRDTTSWASGLADRMAKTLGVAIIAAVTAAGLALGAFFTQSVQKAADLEAQMDTVAALLGATAEQAELLRQATIDLALDPNLKVSATEAAQAIEMLAQNGLTVEEILGGAARATVLLANATGADFTTAARIATDAMALWGMEADQLGQVADGVTAVLVQSKFEVTDYALALAQAGGVAAAAGVSFEDFNATLVAIAPYFASGSDAGTSYKTMLQRLIPTTNTAKDAMSALGLITEEGGNAFFDSQGNMRDMAEVAGILHGALGGLTEQQRLQALSTIFGTDAMRAAVAMSQFTEEEFRHLQAVMANTSAAEIAAQRMQNFSGAMEIFKGVVEGLQLQLGNVLLPILTKLALEGANLLAAWGPALIAAFEQVVAVFGAFFRNLSEGMSVIDAFIEAIWDIAPQPVLDALVAFRDNILPLIERIGEAITSFVSWKDALLAFGLVAAWAVGSVLLPMLAPIAGIVAAVAGLALVFGAVRTAWENDFLGIRTAVEGFVGVVQDAIGVVAAFVSGDMARAAELFERLPGPVQAVVAAVVGFIANIQTLISYIRQVVADGNLLNDALGRLQGAWQPLGLAIGNVVLAVQAFVQALRDGESPLDALRAALPNLGEAARQAGQAIIDGLVGAFTSLGTSISTGLENLKTAIFNWAGTTSWLEVGQKILEGIASFFHNLGDRVAEIEAGLFNWIASAVDGIDWRTVGETIINGIVAAVSAVVGLLAAAGTAIINYFVGFFTNDEIGPAAENLISSLGNGIGEFASGINDGLIKVRDAIFDWAGVEDWSGVAEKIVEMIGTALGTAADAISEQLGDWEQAIFDWAGEEDWQGVAEHIAELVGEKLGEAGSFVSAELSEWEQAVFDWAGEEDWQGVAEHIAELVGEKLGEAGSFVSAKLSEWQTAIFDWAGVEDWQGVAEHIAELVGEKLGEAGSFVSAKLSEWQTAIFDWAGVEDWQGVAGKIAEEVGLKLGEAGSAVVAKLSEWEQAVFDWADGADWGDVAETIAEKVGTWLGDVSDRVTAKLSEWITAITTWVGQQDWKQIGYDMMDRIITAFTEWKEHIAGKINSWLTDTKTETEGYAWWEVGAYILSKIAEGAIGLVSDWTQAIGAWVSNIGQAIAQNMGNLAQLGRDIVGGIVAGIGAAGGIIDGAAQRLAGDTENSMKGAYQTNSPSRLTLPIGYDITAGVAVGIIQGTGLVVDAIQEVAGSVETEGAKAFGEAMKVLAEGLAAGLNAILDLSAFPGVGGSFLDNLRAVVEMLGQMVAEVNRANVYGEEGLKLLGTFVDVAGGIAELMLPLIVALTEIGRFQPPSPEAFTAAMAQLATYLSLTVGDIAAANQYSELVLEGLSAFLGVMEQIADTVGPFIAVLNDINAFGIVDLWFFHEGLAQLWYTMLLVVQKVQELATLGSETLGRMEGLLDVVGAIADLIGPFIESLYELNAFGSVHLDFFHEGLAQLAYVMLMVVGALNEANDWGSAALQAVQQFAETAGAIADMIGPMIEGLLQINALDGTMNEVAYHAVYFRNGVRGLVDALASAAALFTTGTLQHVQEFAETAGAIAEIIVPAVEGLMVIGTLTGDLNYLGLQATYFRNGLRTVVDAIASAASLFTAALLNQTQLFAETAGKIMELIGPAIEGFGLIGTLTGEVNYLGLQAVYLRNGLRIVVDAIASAAELFTAALLNQTQLFADTAGAVVDLIADAIETLALLAGYVAAAGLEAAAAQFAADLVTVVTAIVNALQAGGLLASEALTAAGDLADGLSDVLGVVEDGVDALAALAGYVSVSGIGAKAQQFAVDLAAVITAVVGGLQQAGILADAAVVAAGDLADGLSDVLGVVEDGVEAVTALAGYVPASGIGALAQQFAVDLAAVITAIIGGLQQAGILADAAVVEAGELADGLADILGVVADGVEAIAALAAYVPVSAVGLKAQQFAADLAMVISIIVFGLQDAGILANAAVAAAGELAGKLSDLLGVVADGIEAIKALAEYQGVEGLGEKVQKFTSDLVAVATILATQLNAAADAIGAGTIDAARAFATAVAALAGEVQTAVQGLGQLAGVATPDIDPILAYIVVSAQTIQQSFTTAGDIGQAVQYAANFRQNLEQLVQEVQAAVAQLNALAGMGTTGSIGAALAAIAASLQNTAGQFAGAGTVLANALIEALRSGVSAGEGAVVQATLGVLTAALEAGLNEAREFSRVGDAIIDATVSGVQSGQAQVVAAVVQVVGAAVAAGIDEARRAADVGRQVIQAALAEINAGRGQLDAAGAAAGEAMIDGMARAITNGRSRLVNAIIATVNAAVAAARAALGIASPSRVAEALFGNFMATAELALSDPRGLVAAIGKSTRAMAMVTEAARAAGTLAQMVVPAVPMVAPVAGGAQSVRLTPPALGAGTSSAGAAMGPRAAQAPVYNFYGDFVVEGVQDGPGLLEQLATLTAGARRR